MNFVLFGVWGLWPNIFMLSVHKDPRLFGEKLQHFLLISYMCTLTKCSLPTVLYICIEVIPSIAVLSPDNGTV